MEREDMYITALPGGIASGEEHHSWETVGSYKMMDGKRQFVPAKRHEQTPRKAYTRPARAAYGRPTPKALRTATSV